MSWLSYFFIYTTQFGAVSLAIRSGQHPWMHPWMANCMADMSLICVK